MALLAALSATIARAQDAPRSTPRAGAEVPVLISGAAPSVKLRVVDADTDETVAECQGRCLFSTKRGRYTVYTRDAVADTRRQLSVVIEGRSHFVFEEGNDAVRNGGLVLGIVGPAAIVTGFLMMTPALLSGGCHDPDCTTDGEQLAARVGLGLLIGGAVATPVGWTVFASNRARLVLRADSSTRLAPRLGVSVGGVGGGGLGLVGSARF
jgi:hypothetical protein